MATKTTMQWTVAGKEGFESLRLGEGVEVPPLDDTECLVNFHYGSLNYRDLIITKGKYLFGNKIGVVPVSDGAGTVKAVGKKVTRFRPGDRVMPYIKQGHLPASPTVSALGKGSTGSDIDGVMRQFGAFNEGGLIAIPPSLTFKQACTLPVAALTAWNCLYGLESRALKAGETVLTQGTGGVSLFGLQFAKAAGARVISTTSTKSKAEILRKLGADHVINYKDDPNWGKTARSFTPDDVGVHHIIEIGGPNTLGQSFKAIKVEGVISIVGFMVRGVLAGSQKQFETMLATIESEKIQPVVDEKHFAFEDLKDAYQYMWEQKHLGKVVVQIDG